jgi:hypothetical protein
MSAALADIIMTHSFPKPTRTPVFEFYAKVYEDRLFQQLKQISNEVHKDNYLSERRKFLTASLLDQPPEIQEKIAKGAEDDYQARMDLYLKRSQLVCDDVVGDTYKE